MIALDTETTGLDLYHGAKPFFVTTCMPGKEPVFWQWDVNPLTREPQIPPGDLEEIGDYLFASGPASPVGEAGQPDAGLIFQNGKFDLTALGTVGFWQQWDLPSVWEIVEDTLLAGHALASNQPHDLTSMAMHYLGADILPYEKALAKECNAARRYARSHFPDWKIAQDGLQDEQGNQMMPSAGDKTWKFDSWLPRAIARQEKLPADHLWWTVLEEYANADSVITIHLWQVMKERLKKLDLWEIYRIGIQANAVAHCMEAYGVTGSIPRQRELCAEYGVKSEELGARCVDIAASFNYELTLPKSGNNDSLRCFCFGPKTREGMFGFDQETGEKVEGPLGLPVVARTQTGNPSLDSKTAIPVYLETLKENTPQRDFVAALAGKRKADTARQYMVSYERYWIPLDVWNDKGERLWFRMHPSFNATGTDTLRWSSNNPNAQNISKKEDFNLRYLFGPMEDREWWSLDYENIELRIPAFESGQEELIALFLRPNEPPYYGSEHLLNFSTIYPDIWDRELKAVGYEKVGPHCKEKYASSWYQHCKNGDFAIGYGAQRAKADATFKRAGCYDLLKSRFAKKEALVRHWINFANKHGYVETMPDHTVNPRRGYPIMCSRTEQGRISPTIPLSYHVQSTAMWCTRKAMIRCQNQINQWRAIEGFDAHIVMQVHDELVFDLPLGGKANEGKVKQLKRLMEQSGDDIGVPLSVSMSYHPVSWDKKVKL